MRAPVERIYCLVRCRDGLWLACNRNYKPFGQEWPREQWADYERCPGVRVRLSPRDLARLSGGCVPYRPGDRQVWLYADATQPTRSRSARAAYEARLTILDRAISHEHARSR